MSHFAEVFDGIVNRVLVIDESQLNRPDKMWGDRSNWIQCSYNTRGGVHYMPNSSIRDNGIALRKNFPQIGWTYDNVRDAFIPPKPYPSWVINEDTCLWESSIPLPYTDNTTHNWMWDENNLKWLKTRDMITEWQS